MLYNKIRYLVILILLGWLAILYNEYFMGILFISVLIFPLLLFAILIYIYRMVSLELVSVVHVSAMGEVIPISIQIKNPTIFPIPNMSITIKYFNNFSNSNKIHEQEFNISTDKRITTSVTCNLRSEHSGNLDISFSKARIFDYLKIFSLKKKNLGESRVAVIPRYYELTEDILKNRSGMLIESDCYSIKQAGDDPSEVFAIREYREGDRPQRIHWKLSMKQNQLMIKDFSDPLNCSVVIFADLAVPRGEDGLETTDSSLECALSLSYSFMLKRQIHYLTWYDKTQGICRRERIVTEKDFFIAVNGLLHSGPYIQGVDLATLYYAEYPNAQYTDVFYITTFLASQQLDSLIQIKAINRQILYINKRDYEIKANELKRQEDLPIDLDLTKKITETQMGLFYINSSKIKRDLEGLKLGWF